MKWCKMKLSFYLLMYLGNSANESFYYQVASNLIISKKCQKVNDEQHLELGFEKLSCFWTFINLHML